MMEHLNYNKNQDMKCRRHFIQSESTQTITEPIVSFQICMKVSEIQWTIKECWCIEPCDGMRS